MHPLWEATSSSDGYAVRGEQIQTAEAISLPEMLAGEPIGQKASELDRAGSKRGGDVFGTRSTPASDRRMLHLT